MTDHSVLHLSPLKLNARWDAPVESVQDWHTVKRCAHCGTATWPIGRDDRDRHLAQCLNCGQRYVRLRANSAVP